MRILLDENMPLDYGLLLVGHQVDHIERLGLKGAKNGELLGIARSSYDAFVTLDRGILFQHAHQGSDLIIIALRVPNSRPDTVRKAASALLERLNRIQPGERIELVAE